MSASRWGDDKPSTPGGQSRDFGASPPRQTGKWTRSDGGYGSPSRGSAASNSSRRQQQAPRRDPGVPSPVTSFAAREAREPPVGISTLGSRHMAPLQNTPSRGSTTSRWASTPSPPQQPATSDGNTLSNWTTSKEIPPPTSSDSVQKLGEAFAELKAKAVFDGPAPTSPSPATVLPGPSTSSDGEPLAWRKRTAQPPASSKAPALGGRSRWATDDDDADDTVIVLPDELVSKEPIVLAPKSLLGIDPSSSDATPAPTRLPMPTTAVTNLEGPVPSPARPQTVPSTPPQRSATLTPASWDASPSQHISWADDDEEDDELPELDEEWLVKVPAAAPQAPEPRQVDPPHLKPNAVWRSAVSSLSSPAPVPASEGKISSVVAAAAEPTSPLALAPTVSQAEPVSPTGTPTLSLAPAAVQPDSRPTPAPSSPPVSPSKPTKRDWSAILTALELPPDTSKSAEPPVAAPIVGAVAPSSNAATPPSGQRRARGSGASKWSVNNTQDSVSSTAPVTTATATSGDSPRNVRAGTARGSLAKGSQPDPAAAFARLSGMSLGRSPRHAAKGEVRGGAGAGAGASAH